MLMQSANQCQIRLYRVNGARLCTPFILFTAREYLVATECEFDCRFALMYLYQVAVRIVERRTVGLP